MDAHQQNVLLSDATIIDLVDNIIHDAIEKTASDIHIEPQADYCRVRFRCDGLLFTATTLSISIFNQLVVRIKIMANLNIAERRLPQDGRLQIQYQQKVDMRVCTCPTLFGEKIVLRLFYSDHFNLDVNNIGLEPAQLKLFLTALMQPQGLILVTGPTGSGKSSTLYAALNYLNHVEKNIISIEDPIEVQLNGITQVNINPVIGLDFAHALRSFLRQDPDIILVGEIRDRETAIAALQAAQTGHLVLSSLHTNHARDTFHRLQSLNIHANELISSIHLIVAQRLLRKLCDLCKQNSNHHDASYEATGCARCRQGYKGRLGIFELLGMTEIQSLLANPTSSNPFSDFISLQTAAWKKIKAGMSTIHEMERVLGATCDDKN